MLSNEAAEMPALFSSCFTTRYPIHEIVYYIILILIPKISKFTSIEVLVEMRKKSIHRLRENGAQERITIT
jgi:hypothetical protein